MNDLTLVSIHHLDRRADALVVQRFWPEKDVRVTNRMLWDVEDALHKLRRFHGLSQLVWQQGWMQL